MVWKMLSPAYTPMAWENTVGVSLPLRNCVYRLGFIVKSPGGGDPVCRSNCPDPESMWLFLPGSSEEFGVTGRKEGLLQCFNDHLCFSGQRLQALLSHTFIFGELLTNKRHTPGLLFVSLILSGF